MIYRRVSFDQACEKLHDCFIDYTPEQVKAMGDSVRYYVTDNGSALALSEYPEFVMLWAYQGTNSVRMIADMRAWFTPKPLRMCTYHKGLVRLFKRFNPRILVQRNGFTEFEVTP